MNQRGKPPARTIIALALIVLLGVVTVVAAVTVLQLPDPATEEAKRTNLLYQPVLAVSLFVFWGVTSGIIWAMLRYKRQSEDEELPVQVHGSNCPRDDVDDHPDHYPRCAVHPQPDPRPRPEDAAGGGGHGRDDRRRRPPVVVGVQVPG